MAKKIAIQKALDNHSRQLNSKDVRYLQSRGMVPPAPAAEPKRNPTGKASTSK